MSRTKYITLNLVFSLLAVSCASSTHHYYDSALNDHNRAPASLGIPKILDTENNETTIDVASNQAQADYLFLKAEIESNAGRSSEAIELLKTALVYDPKSATMMQKISVEFYKTGNVQSALLWAENAHEASPTRRDISLLLAGLYTSSKNFQRAEEIYRKLVKADPTDMESALYLGAAYTEDKNYKKAIEAFKVVTKDKEYNSRYLAHYYLARVYSESSPNKTARIKEELNKAIALKPDFFEAVSMLGQYIQKEKGTTALIKFYEKMQKDHPQAKVAEALAQYYINTNQYDKAFEQLEIVDESTEDSVQVKLKMALILIDKKIYDSAIAKLEEILVIAPESDKVRFYLAAVYEEKRQFKEAFAEYLKIEKDSSYFEESRLHAAYLSKMMNDVPKGIEILKAVVPDKAQNPQSYIFMAQLFEDQSDPELAMQILKIASVKFEENAQVIYYLGVVQDKMNLKSEMISSMKKVIEIDPEHSQALNYLAYSWAELGEQLEKAEAYARKAALKEKNDAFILDTLGWVLYKRGDYKKAAEVLEKAHQMQAEVSIIAEHLGDVYAKLNLNEKAFEHFSKAHNLEADAKNKEKIQAKITSLENVLRGLRSPSSVANDSDKKPSQ